jgi:hypothetical protein
MVLDALISLEVPFDIVTDTLGVDKLERVGPETMHVAVRVGDTAIGEYSCDLMK